MLSHLPFIPSSFVLSSYKPSKTQVYYKFTLYLCQLPECLRDLKYQCERIKKKVKQGQPLQLTEGKGYLGVILEKISAMLTL